MTAFGTLPTDCQLMRLVLRRGWGTRPGLALTRFLCFPASALPPRTRGLSLHRVEHGTGNESVPRKGALRPPIGGPHSSTLLFSSQPHEWFKISPLSLIHSHTHSHTHTEWVFEEDPSPRSSPSSPRHPHTPQGLRGWTLRPLPKKREAAQPPLRHSSQPPASMWAPLRLDTPRDWPSPAHSTTTWLK